MGCRLAPTIYMPVSKRVYQGSQPCTGTKLNNMETIIYHKTVNGIEVTWTKRTATPNAKRKGYKFIIEQAYRDLATGVIKRDYQYTKN